MTGKNINLLNKDSVVLITGGAKGITAQCSIKIAEFMGCRLILVGRSSLLDQEPSWAVDKVNSKALQDSAIEFFKKSSQKTSPRKIESEIKKVLSSREIQETLQKVAGHGASAVYISADVTKPKLLRAAIKKAEEDFGGITGIIHGAGNLADKRIEQKTGGDFDLVVKTKVNGLLNVLDAIDTETLNFLVLFSSVAGFYGNAGQTDYAIANEILNKSAHIIQRKLPDCQVLSINWGPWDAGMVSPRLKKFFEAKNVRLIPTEFGVNTLIEELTKNEITPPQIIIGSALGAAAYLNERPPAEVAIRRSIARIDNPFLDDHQIGSKPVLPATCASAWIADTCLSLHPGYSFTHMEDFKILKGLTFNDHSCDYVIDLKPAASSNKNMNIYDALITSEDDQGRRIFHYSGQVTLSKKQPERPVHSPIDQMDLDQANFKPGLDFYHDGTLFHGPSFQGIQQVLLLSEEKVIIKVFLPELTVAAMGQFPVRSTNPYVNDAVVQSLLLWTQDVYDAPCLPSRLHQWDQYHIPTFNEFVIVILQVTHHNQNAVSGDIQVMDEDGREFYSFFGLEGTISKHLKRYIGKKNS